MRTNGGVNKTELEVCTGKREKEADFAGRDWWCSKCFMSMDYEV